MLTGRSRGKNNARGTENGELESSRRALEYAYIDSVEEPFLGSKDDLSTMP